MIIRTKTYMGRSEILKCTYSTSFFVYIANLFCFFRILYILNGFIFLQVHTMKDYSTWHRLKRKIDAIDYGMLDDAEKLIYTKHMYREREIWWCSIWENIWHEQDGKNEQFERPVLILRKFSQDVFLGIPMTSTTKNHPFYFPYTLGETPGSFILSQARILSVKRLQRKMSSIWREIYTEIKSAYIGILS
jgi:mRNA interferase MazF